MLSERVRQDQISNDLANSSTPGYKADRTTQRSFGDLMLQNASTGRAVGSLGMGVSVDRVVTDLTPAPMRTTGEPLDFAVEGEGYFGVQTPQGLSYTRNGQFQAAGNGTLVTSTGAPVLGPNGQPVILQPDGKVPEGAVGVFAVQGARKRGETFMDGQAIGAATGRARSGMLEGSGADPARSVRRRASRTSARTSARRY